MAGLSSFFVLLLQVPVALRWPVGGHDQGRWQNYQTLRAEAVKALDRLLLKCERGIPIPIRLGSNAMPLWTAVALCRHRPEVRYLLKPRRLNFLMSLCIYLHAPDGTISILDRLPTPATLPRQGDKLIFLDGEDGHMVELYEVADVLYMCQRRAFSTTQYRQRQACCRTITSDPRDGSPILLVKRGGDDGGVIYSLVESLSNRNMGAAFTGEQPSTSR